MSGYLKFRKFVRGLTVVNDPAERVIKLIQDFVECSHDEELRQDTMLAVSDHRKKFPRQQKKICLWLEEVGENSPFS